MEELGGYWSVTAYLGAELAQLIHSPIDRYVINVITTEGLVYDDNGALTLYLQKKRPDTDAKAANWLPSPDPEFAGYETGAFHLVTRVYLPNDRTYFPPGVIKAGSGCH